jgi:hypothetical protein
MAIGNGLCHPKWDGEWCDVCHFPSIPTHQLDAHRYSGPLFRQAEQTRNAPSPTDSRLISPQWLQSTDSRPKRSGNAPHGHRSWHPRLGSSSLEFRSLSKASACWPVGPAKEVKLTTTTSRGGAAEEEDDNNCLRERPHGLGILRVWRWAAEEIMEEAMSAKWNPRKRCRGVATQSSSSITTSRSSSGIGE